MKKIIELTEDAVIIDDRLFTANDLHHLDRCPRCGNEVYSQEKEGFYARFGCLACDVWFNKPVCKDY